MNTELKQEAMSEFQMTQELSLIYSQITYLLRSFGDIQFTPLDFVGECNVRLVSDSITKTVYRGYMCLNFFRHSSFQRIEFCVINTWGRNWWKSKRPVAPIDTMIMLGWDSEVEEAGYALKRFGCRLFRSESDSHVADVHLQVGNWARPFLWGGQVPSFLTSNKFVEFMFKSGLDACEFVEPDGTVTSVEVE